MNELTEPPFKITKEIQLKELNTKIPPIVNVDVVVFKKNLNDFSDQGKFLIGRRNPKHLLANNKPLSPVRWLFPGGRMKFTETPQETAERILKTELTGVNARLKKLATVVADKGWDSRANGVTIYFLYEYESGEPKSNDQLNEFMWGDSEDIRKKDNAYIHDISILEELEAIVRTMNTSEDELIVEVDKDNKEIGTMIKRDAHSTTERFHRAAHIMIFNSKGQVILQQRSLNHTRFAGFWDMIGGHQSAGLTIDQTAKQELMEELGVNIELKSLKVFLHKQKDQLEYCHVYYGLSDGPYGFDRNEVAAISAFDCEKLLNGYYDSDYEFVPPFAKQYTEDLRFFWEKLKN